MVVCQAAGIALVVLGIIICFLGYRLLRAVISIAGFVAGVVGATWLGGDVLHLGRTWVLVVGIGGGIIGAVLAAVLYRLGIFILGALGGALAVLAFLPGPRPLVSLVVAVVCGILTLLLQKVLVAIITSFVGAWGVVAGAFHLAGWIELPVALDRARLFVGTGQRGLVMLATWVVLGVIGVIVQLAAGKQNKPE